MTSPVRKLTNWLGIRPPQMIVVEDQNVFKASEQFQHVKSSDFVGRLKKKTGSFKIVPAEEFQIAKPRNPRPQLTVTLLLVANIYASTFISYETIETAIDSFSTEELELHNQTMVNFFKEITLQNWVNASRRVMLKISRMEKL